MGFKTWVSEEVLASSDVNSLLMKQTVIVCTSGTRPGSPNEGMMIYETDTDTYRGHDGSAWQEIFMLNPPRAEITRTGTQAIAHSTQTTVTWQSAVYNVRNMWNSGVNPSRLTIPAGMGGTYLIQVTLEYEVTNVAQDDVGSRQAAILKNGAIMGRQTSFANGGTNATRVEYNRTLSLAAADYIEVAAFQNSGISRNLNVTQSQPFITIRRIGP